MYRQIVAALAAVASSVAWAGSVTPLGTPLSATALGTLLGITTLGLPVTVGGVLVVGATALALGIRIARRKRK